MTDDIVMLWVWVAMICFIGLIVGLSMYLYTMYKTDPEFVLCWTGSLVLGLTLVMIIF